LLDNNTKYLLTDMEKIRVNMNVDKWMLFAGSWGTTLSLAYAGTYPSRVTEMILWGVTTTRKQEIDWITWGMGHIFPKEFDEFLYLVKDKLVDNNIPLAYNKLLMSCDPTIYMPASRAWCSWEDRIVSLGNHISPSSRYLDDKFRLCFTRLVTHYFGHYGFLDDNYIIRNLQNISDIPLIMVRGRLDISSQLSSAWTIYKQLPLSDLYLIDDSGHGGSKYMHQVLLGATEYFAEQ